MTERHTDRVVLVTGSSRGLGKIIAGRFLEEGALVVISSQKEDELKQAENQLRNVSDKLQACATDLRDEQQVQKLIEKTVSEFGSLDILVNNAGVFKMGAVDEMDLADFELTLEVNLKGAFLVSKYAVKQMKKQNRGQIVNICSIGSKLGLENLSAYCASKAGLARFGDSLKAELKPFGIKVTNIFPHAMNTMGKDITADSNERLTMIEPHDVADAIIMVTSSKEYVQYQDVTIYPYSTKLTKTEENN
jgi:NADP-dependent 3-hydroxy acid dehydrogenase YdfG